MSTSSNITAAPAPAPDAPRAPSPSQSPLDYDVVVVLAAMLCALGLNSMLRRVVRCARRAVSGPAGWAARRHAHAGLKREEVVALPVATYVAASPSGRASPAQQQRAPAGCAICLSDSDFADGERRVRVLPVCAHRFHVACVDRWLVSRCSCPTCRRRLSSDDDSAGGGHDRLQVLALV